MHARPHRRSVRRARRCLQRFDTRETDDFRRRHARNRKRHHMNRLRALHDAGVSIWLDMLSRELLESGAFAAMIAEDAVTGATSNPTIFAKAIGGSDLYDEQLRAAQRDDQGPGHRRRRAGDRGAHRARPQRQHHAALLRRALRAGHRRLHGRPRAARRRRAAGRRDRLRGVVLRLAHRRQGRPAAACRLEPARPGGDRQRARGLRAVPGAVRRRALERAARRGRAARSGRCGPAPARRTRPTPTSSTSRS